MIGRFKDDAGGQMHPWRERRASLKLPVLAAEPSLDDLKRLTGSLTQLGFSVRVAMSASEVIDMARHEMFDRAIVAAEFLRDDAQVLTRLASLPMVQRLVATGPSGDGDLEVRARIAGANLYVPRPVSPESLAGALAIAGYAGAHE